MKDLIKRNKAVVVAADVKGLDELEKLVRATCDVEGIEGYKVGFASALTNGLGNVVDAIRQYTKLPIIYDHQKGGTDIPELGTVFAEVVADSGCNAAILFPFGGAATQREWIKALKEKELTVLVGGHMTQKEFLTSERGYITDNSPHKIYILAVDCGITNFVVPGNKIEFVRDYRKLIEFNMKGKKFRLWAPGFINQNGIITVFGEEAGDCWVAIVGSAIYKAKNMKEAAEMVTASLR